MITIREFQRNFCTLKDQTQEVCGSDGKRIGVWTPDNGLNNTVGRVLPTTSQQIAQKKLFNGLLDTVGHAAQPPMLIPEVKQSEDGLQYNVGHTCAKCLTIHPELYKIWEEGDEHKVCVNCLKQKIPAKRLKSYLSRLEKVV